jgi:hypothetical protein
MRGMFNFILDNKKRPPNTKPPLPTNNIIKTPLLVFTKLACVYASTKYVYFKLLTLKPLILCSKLFI